MKSSLYIGKIAGIGLFIHWTFPIIIIWIVISNLRSGLSGEQILWSVLFVLALFACVTLHELGHALAAKRYHIRTKDITLYPIGGVASLERIPDKPVHELVVAVAGPFVNFVIFVLLILLMQVGKISTDFATITYLGADNFLLSLAAVNVWLAVFNLIPAFPMDGGRILRALLSLKWSRVVATNVAARIGQFIAILFVFFGFFYNPFLVFIGLFVFLGAMAESQQVQTESILKGHTVSELVMRQIPVIDKHASVNEAVKLLLDGQAKNFLVTEEGRPFGTINRDAIIKALSEKKESDTLETIADTDLIYIEHTEPVENLLQLLSQHKNTLVIVNKEGALFGVVDLENLMEYIMIKNAFSQGEKT